MAQRPDIFTLNESHHLANGLVFAGLGAHAGSTRYHDSSVFSNHGALTNMDPATDWVWDSTLNRFMLDFDGADDRVVHPDLATVLQKTYTFAFWAYTATNGDVAWGGQTSDYVQYADATSVYHSVSSPAQGYCSKAHGGITGLHHWAISRNGTATITFYKDGVSLGTSNLTNNNVFGSLPQIGGYTAGNLDYLGRQADNMCWKEALSGSVIAQLADPSNVMLSGLINYPLRKWWPVVSGAAVFKPYWANQATQVAM